MPFIESARVYGIKSLLARDRSAPKQALNRPVPPLTHAERPAVPNPAHGEMAQG